MAWNQDRLAPVETLHYCSDRVKVGSFVCDADHPSFPVSESLDNDVFVLPKMPLWVRRDDDDFVFAEPGALLLHRAGQTLRRRPAATGELTYWFGVRPDIFQAVLERYQLPTRHMGDALLAGPRFRFQIAAFLQRLAAKQYSEQQVDQHVLGFLNTICYRRATSNVSPLTEMSTSTTARRQRLLVDRARVFINSDTSGKIAITEVAEAAGTSVSHLCRLFRAHTGLTMSGYRMRQRLWHVSNRLLDGQANSLTELAHEYGFSSHSHLSRSFQQHMGVAPSLLRASRPNA